jgi:predicted component of type VI protein secretion system
MKIVSVAMIPSDIDPLSLKFEVTGAIRVNDREVPVRLATVVSSEGKVEVGT